MPFLLYPKRTLALSKSSEFTKRMQTLMTEQRFVVYDDPNTTAVFGRVRRSVSPHFLHFFFFPISISHSSDYFVFLFSQALAYMFLRF